MMGIIDRMSERLRDLFPEWMTDTLSLGIICAGMFLLLMMT